MFKEPTLNFAIIFTQQNCSVTHFYYEYVLLNGTPLAVISLPFKGNIHIKSQPIYT